MQLTGRIPMISSNLLLVPQVPDHTTDLCRRRQNRPQNCRRIVVAGWSVEVLLLHRLHRGFPEYIYII